jgi:diphosphomevalonate decarboxylase
MRKVTIRAGSNIAFIKYWGVSDPSINLPLNNSISLTLADAHTTTTVAWDLDGHLDVDEITLDGVRLAPAAAERLVRHLDRMRALAGIPNRARVVSRNNFPMASGIASSASGFAALTVAATRALGLELDDLTLSALARLGSGSASRSIFGGYVEWERGHDHCSSVARTLYPPEYWDLRDVVAVVSSTAKHTSSAGGHLLASTSPLNSARLAHVEQILPQVRRSIDERSLLHLGPLIELDTLAMHSVMMTSTPALLYWQPATLEILQAVRRWREEDLPVYFTIDAGPNVHLICEAANADTVNARLRALPGVERTIVSRPGHPPQELDDHLF